MLPWRRTLWWASLVVDRRNKVPSWQPSRVDEAGPTLPYIKLATVPTFSLPLIADLGQIHWAIRLFEDDLRWLAMLLRVAEVGCFIILWS